MYDIPPSWRGERRGNGEITEDYFEPAADVMCGSVGSIFCFLRLRRSDWDASHEGRIVRILYIRRVFVSERVKCGWRLPICDVTVTALNGHVQRELVEG
jgi:hypothetical protein